MNFFDRKSIVCVQVERLEKLFPKIENLLREGKYDEAKKLLAKSKDYNEKNPLYLFYKSLIAYCASPNERRRKQLMSALEKI